MAAITEEQYKEALDTIKKYKQQLISTLREIDDHIVDPNADLYEKLSVRAYNILVSNDLVAGRDPKVKDLENISISALKKCRNCGFKTVNEILDLCEKAGITMIK